ncbi:GAF domain-containing protein [Nocardioides sp. AX2bis]|uniref:GAF domain-containing protein n=1 Tax=Nocardioides sp. AX2bis TaxID=2653157 RepID=UPI0013574457|nr:GAF domain-containing protein [Nocardioides sp. AX2bis]
MDPTPETARTLNQLEPVLGESDDALLDHFRDAGRSVLAVVPDCVGFSLSRLEDDLVFTMLSTAEDIALLDATQYLDDGPCLAAVRTDAVVGTWTDDPLSEDRWLLFATTASELGVRSTLTLPIHQGDQVSGSVNLYAASPEAFVGHHEDLAQVFGAWSAGAVTNADLSFDSRRQAERGPQVAADLSRIQVAIGIVAATLGTDVFTAEKRLRRAADLAGLPEATLATSLIALVHPPDDDVR